MSLSGFDTSGYGKDGQEFNRRHSSKESHDVYAYLLSLVRSTNLWVLLSNHRVGLEGSPHDGRYADSLW